MTTDFTFGSKPERLKQLLTLGLEESDVEEHTRSTSPLDLFTQKPGSRLDSYKLGRVLGEGGMGVVYLAEQMKPMRRQVAIKVIKPGMDSARVVARFEAERQTLALLDHPNIAHVHDAGTTDQGRPYFVMEYVAGHPITEYCDHYKLSITDRLSLFQQVCHAVQHAHQKGIIHRDLKPSNILVSATGDQVVPKIIDFGVAKAIRQPLTEHTQFTEEHQLLGTPQYMSPEQADMASEDIDTRSDVYSLGVLLYELLAGILPYNTQDLRKGGLEHIRKIIRTTDPKTPSIRLTSLGVEAGVIADRRRTQIHVLTKYLRQELEWIPLKAMCKERSERYRSASELADDIENYLKGDPLMAGPPTAGYRLRKFLRRHRTLASGVAAVLFVLVAGIVVSTVFAVVAERARIEADIARTEAQLITEFLKNDVLGSAGKARVGEATVSYVLNAASERLEGKFKDKPLIEASIRLSLGFTCRQIGESDEAEQHFSKAINIYKQHYGEEHLTTLIIEDYVGYIYEDQGRYHDMERLWARILEIRQRAYGVEYPAGTINGLAVALCHLGKYEEAESWFKKALQSEETWYKVGGESIDMSPYLKCNLARVYTAKGRYEEAEQLLRKNIDSARADAAGMDVKYGVNLRYSAELANVYREWGRYDKAEPEFEETLKVLREAKGDEHFLTSLCMYGLVRLYVDRDRYEEAEKLFGEALPIARRRLREDHPVTLRLVNTLAVLRTKQRQYDEAETLFDEALKGRQRELGEDHPDTLETINDLGLLHRAQEHYQEAEKLLTEALQGRQRKLGPDHPHTLASRHELGMLCLAQSQYEQAESNLLKAFSGRKIKLGPEHPYTVETLNQLIKLYEAWDKPDEAKTWRAKLAE